MAADTLIKGELLQTKKTVYLARWLLGKYLVRQQVDGSTEARMIIETEAYHGQSDLACHAAKGRTKRTETLYATGGVWYVYLCYGIHEMLNLVVGPADWPAAILIRGLEGSVGPGRLTKALSIDRKFNGRGALDPETKLWIEDRGQKVPARLIKTGPRVGVDYAGEIWAAKKWRFSVDPAKLR